MHVVRFAAALTASLAFVSLVAAPEAVAQPAPVDGPVMVWCRLFLYDVFDDPPNYALAPSASVAPFQPTVLRMQRLARNGRAKLLTLPAVFTIESDGSATSMLGASAPGPARAAAKPAADGIAISVHARAADDGTIDAEVAIVPHGPSLRVYGSSVTRIRELSARERLKPSELLVLSGFYNAQDDASTASFFGPQNAIGTFAEARASDTLHDSLVVLLEMHRQDTARNSGPLPPLRGTPSASH